MSRTSVLAIRIISDEKNATKGLANVEKSAGSMSSKIGKASKIAVVGLAALGAAAFKSGQAAAEDAKAQSLLANSMRNAAGATKSQIRATEDWIDKTARAAGVADDELRPALATLVRATGDVSKSQTTLKVAMDVAAATGRDLGSVSDAIAKGYGGQTTALGRLVPGMDKALLASGDMSKIMDELKRTTNGAALEAANSAGNTEKMSIAFAEAQETIGGVFLPVMDQANTVLATTANVVENNSTLVTRLVAVLAVLGVAVITINATYRAYAATLAAVAIIQKGSVILTAAQSAATTVLFYAILTATAAQMGLAAATRVLTAAMAANPVGALIVGLLLVGSLLVLAYKKSDRFRAIMQVAGRGAMVAMGWVLSILGKVSSWLGDKVPAAARKIPAAIKFAFQLTPIGAAVSAIDRVARAAQSVVSWLSRIRFPKPPSWVTKAGSWLTGGGLGGPGPATSGGGSGYAISSRGGRGGPAGAGSLIMPMGGTTGGGDTIQITIQGAVDPVATAKQIRTILARDDLRNGRR